MNEIELKEEVERLKHCEDCGEIFKGIGHYNTEPTVKKLIKKKIVGLVVYYCTNPNCQSYHVGLRMRNGQVHDAMYWVLNPTANEIEYNHKDNYEEEKNIWIILLQLPFRIIWSIISGRLFVKLYRYWKTGSFEKEDTNANSI